MESFNNYKYITNRSCMAVKLRHLHFNEWIKPLRLTKQIFRYIPQPKKTLLLLKLPISLLILKIYDNQTIFVAEEDGEIMGISIAQVKGNVLIIEATVVDSSYRKRGISKRLKSALEEKGKELGAAYALTKIESKNKTALAMAKSQGYYLIEKPDLYRKKLE